MYNKNFGVTLDEFKLKGLIFEILKISEVKLVEKTLPNIIKKSFYN